jgi:hypothetical protein
MVAAAEDIGVTHISVMDHWFQMASTSTSRLRRRREAHATRRRHRASFIVRRLMGAERSNRRAREGGGSTPEVNVVRVPA